MRAIWYLFNATMQDEDTQRKGMVGIKSNFGQHARQEPLTMFKQVDRVISGIPKKIVGMHYCYDDASLKPFVQGFQLFLTREMRNRFRPHFGDADNLLFELQTYGIPTKYHPILPNGSLSLEYHKEWLNNRRMQEESKSNAESNNDEVDDGNIIMLPRRFDILLGRGKYTREHTGNLRAVHLVEMHRAEYERAGKFAKTTIAEKILQLIHEANGRFLKWENYGWVEVDDKVARDKISHFFRHLRSKTTTTTSGIQEEDDTTTTGTSTEVVSTGGSSNDASQPSSSIPVPKRNRKRGLTGSNQSPVVE